MTEKLTVRSAVQVLMHNEVHIFAGAALQTYTVPGVKELQRRLYVTRFAGTANVGNGITAIWRLNINSLMRWVAVNKTLHLKSSTASHNGMTKFFPNCPCKVSGHNLYPSYCGECKENAQGPCFHGNMEKCGSLPAIATKGPALTALGYFQNPGNSTGLSDEELWNMFAKRVNVPTSSAINRYTRLTYADGKLYYLNANTNQRATLRSTDVVSQRTSQPFVSA